MGTSANTSNMAYIPATAHAQLAAYAIWDFLTRSGVPARVVLLNFGAEPAWASTYHRYYFVWGTNSFVRLSSNLIVQLHGVRPFGYPAGILPEIDLEPRL